MNRDDIIRMARESGLTQFTGNYDQSWALERFFHMAYAAGAAGERNKLAQWMIKHSYATGHGDTMENLLKELEWQVIAAEREACAQVCETLDAWNEDDPGSSAATAIRARSKA